MADHDDIVARAFTAQADSFAHSAVANASAALDAIVAAAAPQSADAWLEAACGPGIVGRRLAPLVDRVHGVDMTPAMVTRAREAGARAGLENVTFEVGDATATGLPGGSFDGAVTRFALHHIPLPGRVVTEMARLVRPGGAVVLADHLADDDSEAFAWSQEIERLRDPSHWASLTRDRLRALAADASLRPDGETVVDLELDFDDWLVRGTADGASRALVERGLADAPATARHFHVQDRAGHRTLVLAMWIGRFTVR